MTEEEKLQRIEELNKILNDLVEKLKLDLDLDSEITLEYRMELFEKYNRENTNYEMELYQLLTGVVN